MLLENANNANPKWQQYNALLVRVRHYQLDIAMSAIIIYTKTTQIIISKFFQLMVIYKFHKYRRYIH